MCVIGAGSAFAESTLAQIYKKKNDSGECFGMKNWIIGNS